ncbi:MAG: hypothetical protein JWN65_1802 [Solirubrobacterales bacterium]|nr:hypothetical protein [Solirubrobacterales bacterium]
MSTTFIAAVTAPAAGSPIIQIVIASAFALVTTTALLALIVGHRSGRSQALARAGRASSRLMGGEPWAALPMTVASVGLIAGGFGVFWDIALHIDVGRDEGPLANPSHYPILFALYSIFAAGMLSIALHERAERPAPRAITLPGGFSAPIGGALLLLCGVFALSGFPMDDMWHRMFGQDVTLWGPTHLIMINGAILSPPILAILALESKQARGGHALDGAARSFGETITRAFIPGAMLFSIAFWATEFDWGVPQYRMVWQPLLLSLAGAFALVAGRLWLGRGGAVVTFVFYAVSRGLMELMLVGLDQTAPTMPIFVVEALIIEAICWHGMPQRSPVRVGVLAGLVCGTAGFAAQYVWMAEFSPQPWTTSILAEGIPTAVVAGIAGGVLGGLLGSAMRGTLPARPVRRRAAFASSAAIVALAVNALWLSNATGVRTDVTLEPVAGTGVRTAYVTAKVTPASAAQDNAWFNALTWQTGGKRVVARMRQRADGTWRSDRPVPLGGEGKSLLRLHKGRSMLGIALYLPSDPAIPRAGVVRPDRFSAPLMPDNRLMQTERKDYVPGWLWTPAALVMILCCMAFLVAMSAGIARATETRTDVPPADPSAGDDGGPDAGRDPEPDRRAAVRGRRRVALTAMRSRLG